MLNKAMKLMDQRNNMVKEAYQVLNVLGVDVAQQVINQITINKGKIIAVTDTRSQEEIDGLYKEVERHIGRINQLAVEVEEKDQMIMNQANKIANLEKQLADAQAKINELTNTAREEETVMQQEQTTETYDENDEVLQNLYTKLKQGQMTLEKCKPALKAKVQKSIELLEKQIAERIEELKNNKDTLTMEVADTMHHDVQGEITIDDKTYLYKATNNHYMPIVYGAMSQDVLDKAKEMINKRVKTMNIPFNFAPQVTEFDEVVYDFERQIVVWKTTEGQYKGYTNEYIFAWDGKSAVPVRKLFKNALNDKRTLYKPMNGANGSKKQKEEGQRILSLIDDIFGGETNEIVVNTNENVNNNTNEEDVPDALFGVDDME
jgi:uncharacterized coiled-coil DUF342 family protein